MDILVGLTFFEPCGEVSRQEQFHGVIQELDAHATQILPCGGGRARSIPTNLKGLRPAPGGSYRLASSRIIVEGPTLLTSWMFTRRRDAKGREYYDALPNDAPMTQSRVPSEWDFTYRWEEERILGTIARFADEYIGRTILLGLNILGRDGRLKRQEQHVGTIMLIDVDQGVLVATDSEEGTFRLPGDPALIERAPQGVYRLRSSGRVVNCPNYLAEFTMRDLD